MFDDLMLCTRCGKLIDDDRILCDDCEEEMDKESKVSEAFKPEMAHKPGSTAAISSVAIKVICIITAVAVVVALLIAFWRPLMRILGYPLGFDTPQEHFAYVEGKALDKLNDSITSTYGRAQALTDKKEFAAEAEVHLRLGREVLDLLGHYLAENGQLDVSWLQDIMLKIDYSMDSGVNKSVFTLGLNDIPLIDAEMIMDVKEGALLTSFPALADGYIKTDLQQDAESTFDAAAFKDYLSAFPAEQDINILINKYMRLIISGITDVKSEDTSITVDEITQDCTVLTATVDEATVNKILISLLTEARDDEALREMIKGIIFYDSNEGLSDFDNEWIKSVDDALVQAEEALKNSVPENYILLSDYVDSKNNIIGRRITVSENESIYYILVADGKEFAFEADVMNVFALQGSGSIGNVVNAQCEFVAEGTKIASIVVSDMDTVKLSRGLLDGVIRITPSDDINKQLAKEGIEIVAALELVMNADAVQEDVSLNLLAQDKLIAGLTVKGKEKNYEPLSIPRNVVDASNEEALIQWMSSLKYDKLLKNMKKAGVSQEWLDMFAFIISAA